VTVHHRNAEEFLRRDCRNVATFFGRQGLAVDPDDLYDFVTAAEPEQPGASADENESD
jgi:RIO kinase 1